VSVGVISSSKYESGALARLGLGVNMIVEEENGGVSSAGEMRQCRNRLKGENGVGENAEISLKAYHKWRNRGEESSAAQQRRSKMRIIVQRRERQHSAKQNMKAAACASKAAIMNSTTEGENIMKRAKLMAAAKWQAAVNLFSALKQIYKYEYGIKRVNRRGRECDKREWAAGVVSNRKRVVSREYDKNDIIRLVRNMIVNASRVKTDREW